MSKYSEYTGLKEYYCRTYIIKQSVKLYNTAKVFILGCFCSGKSKDYVSWEYYSNKVRFIDLHNFQQSTRLENVKNIKKVGAL